MQSFDALEWSGKGSQMGAAIKPADRMRNERVTALESHFYFGSIESFNGNVRLGLFRKARTEGKSMSLCWPGNAHWL